VSTAEHMDKTKVRAD